MNSNVVISKRFITSKHDYDLEFVSYNRCIYRSLLNTFQTCANEEYPFCEIANLKFNVKSTIIGFVHKSIVGEFDIIYDDASFQNLASPKPASENQALDSEIFIEDLTSKIQLNVAQLHDKKAFLSNGVLTALQGTRTADATFDIDEIKTPELPQIPNSFVKSQFDKLLFTNLFFPNTTEDELIDKQLQLASFLSQDTKNQTLTVNCSGINFEMFVDDYYNVRQSVFDRYDFADTLLSYLAYFTDLHILPRSTDGCLSAYPIQPVSCSLLPMCSKISNVFKVTSPHAFTIDNRRFLVFSTDLMDHILSRVLSLPQIDAFEYFIRCRQLCFSGPHTIPVVPSETPEGYILTDDEFPSVIVGFTTLMDKGYQTKKLTNGTLLILVSASNEIIGISVHAHSLEVKLIEYVFHVI